MWLMRSLAIIFAVQTFTAAQFFNPANSFSSAASKAYGASENDVDDKQGSSGFFPSPSDSGFPPATSGDSGSAHDGGAPGQSGDGTFEIFGSMSFQKTSNADMMADMYKFPAANPGDTDLAVNASFFGNANLAKMTCYEEFKDPLKLIPEFPHHDWKDYETVEEYIADQKPCGCNRAFESRANTLVDAILSCINGQMSAIGLDDIKLPDMPLSKNGKTYELKNGHIKNMAGLYRIRDTIVRFTFPEIAVFAEFGKINLLAEYDVISPDEPNKPGRLSGFVSFAAIAAEIKVAFVPEPRPSLEEYETTIGRIKTVVTGLGDETEADAQEHTRLVNKWKLPLVFAFDSALRGTVNIIIETLRKAILIAIGMASMKG